MSTSKFSIEISVKEYSVSLLVLALVLVSVHTGLYLYHYQVEELPWLLRQLFDLDEENNIPTWYSSFLLLNNAFFLYIYSIQKEVVKRSYWGLLSAGFLLLAIDEVAGLHETLNTAIEMNWAILGAIGVLFVGVLFVPFLLAIRRRLAMMFMLSGLLYFSGAILVELLGEDLDSDSLLYAFTVALEEGLELIGAWIFLNVLLGEMQAEGSVSIPVEIE
ncbi:MAG: hypothetical protein ACJAY7_001821 [Pseudohongiellaceae bacterium]|jgi:hypothetical protein